jgi:hypothetical protein
MVLLLTGVSVFGWEHYCPPCGIGSPNPQTHRFAVKVLEEIRELDFLPHGRLFPGIRSALQHSTAFRLPKCPELQILQATVLPDSLRMMRSNGIQQPERRAFSRQVMHALRHDVIAEQA